MKVVSLRRWLFLISAIVIVPGIISLVIPPSIKPGIEFTSGSVLNLTFVEPVAESEIRMQLTTLGHPDAVVQKLGSKSVLIRTKLLKDAPRDAVNAVGERELIEQTLSANVGSIEASQFDSTSPIVAAETVRNSAIAVAVAAIGILIYITWAFRNIPNPFRYGGAAIVALIHDLLVVLGIFSILGKVIGLEVNAMFIVGLLTVLGYSVNDTIVVFDRIRENVARSIDRPIEEVVNESVLQSLGRSLNTSLTTLIVLVALLLLGGPTIKELLIALAIGVVSGTYSSIAVASQMLVIWERGEFRKVLRFLRLVPARSN